MSLAGAGAVAIWHDIAPEGREEFYAWHGQEHMPERLAIPGFLRGRRFAALDADLEFFNLYETRNIDVAKSPGYKMRVDNPTPWTLAAVKHFRSVARSICRVEASIGKAQGGLCATWRYDVPDDKTEAHRRALADSVLPKAAKINGMAAIHLLVADAEASGVATAEQIARGIANSVPRWIIMLEGWGDTSAFASLCDEVIGAHTLQKLGAAGTPVRGLYQHQITRGKTDAV